MEISEHVKKHQGEHKTLTYRISRPTIIPWARVGGARSARAPQGIMVGRVLRVYALGAE